VNFWRLVTIVSTHCFLRKAAALSGFGPSLLKFQFNHGKLAHHI